jgi:hypothetical protein
VAVSTPFLCFKVTNPHATRNPRVTTGRGGFIIDNNTRHYNIHKIFYLIAVYKPEAANTVRAPDDERCAAQNMLSLQ